MQPEETNNLNNAKVVPFFARFLEGQLDPELYQDVSEEEMETISGGKRKKPKPPKGGKGDFVTLKYPSDNEEDGIRVTLKYPSDGDEI